MTWNETWVIELDVHLLESMHHACTAFDSSWEMSSVSESNGFFPVNFGVPVYPGINPCGGSLHWDSKIKKQNTLHSGRILLWLKGNQHYISIRCDLSQHFPQDRYTYYNCYIYLFKFLFSFSVGLYVTELMLFNRWLQTEWTVSNGYHPASTYIAMALKTLKTCVVDMPGNVPFLMLESNIECSHTQYSWRWSWHLSQWRYTRKHILSAFLCDGTYSLEAAPNDTYGMSK